MASPSKGPGPRANSRPRSCEAPPGMPAAEEVEKPKMGQHDAHAEPAARHQPAQGGWNSRDLVRLGQHRRRTGQFTHLPKVKHTTD